MKHFLNVTNNETNLVNVSCDVYKTFVFVRMNVSFFSFFAFFGGGR